MKLKAAGPKWDFHPYANLFPLMEGDEFDRLVSDIGDNGLIHPIVIHEGKILDGRNRYRACQILQLTPQTVAAYSGDSPLEYVLSANLQRRHLNETQLGIVAARLANLKHGGDRSKQAATLPVAVVTQANAAEMLHVSERTVRDARKVLDKATPALLARAESGEVAVSVVAKLVDLPASAQNELASQATEAELRNAGKAARRDQREIEQAEATEAASIALGSKLYGVIYADPPWRFAPRSRKTGLDRAADNHYQTMTTEAICALEIPAADDAALFLWATMPMLPQAFDVMTAWGFDYKSGFVWVKEKIGTGYWARNKHELLLIGTRGHIPAPAPGTQFESVIIHATDRHSAKPAVFAEMIEEMFPTAQLLEMFAREPRAGWDSWGNELRETIQ